LPVKAASQADSDGIESHCALSFGAPYGSICAYECVRDGTHIETVMSTRVHYALRRLRHRLTSPAESP